MVCPHLGKKTCQHNVWRVFTIFPSKYWLKRSCNSTGKKSPPNLTYLSPSTVDPATLCSKGRSKGRPWLGEWWPQCPKFSEYVFDICINLDIVNRYGLNMDWTNLFRHINSGYIHICIFIACEKDCPWEHNKTLLQSSLNMFDTGSVGWTRCWWKCPIKMDVFQPKISTKLLKLLVKNYPIQISSNVNF